jgi:hypothetical protein
LPSAAIGDRETVVLPPNQQDWGCLRMENDRTFRMVVIVLAALPVVLIAAVVFTQ